MVTVMGKLLKRIFLEIQSFEIGVIHNIVDSPLLYVITWQ